MAVKATEGRFMPDDLASTVTGAPQAGHHEPQGLALDVLGATPSSAAWEAVLRALAAWPGPETITIERRLVRHGRRGLREEIRGGSDAEELLSQAADSVAGLLRPLRVAGVLREQRRRPVDCLAAGDVAILDGVGSRALGDAATLGPQLIEDLLELPAGATLALVVVRRVSVVEEGTDAGYLTPLLRELTPGVSGEAPLSAALRLCSSEGLPPAMLARLAALAGLDGRRWAITETAAERIWEQRAIARTAPPWLLSTESGGAMRPRPADPARVARLLGSAALSPPPDPRRPRLGRPYTGPLAKEGALLGQVPVPSGALRPLRVPWEQRRRHMFVCGRTGAGKSELIARLAADDVESGRGLVLIDPHGDLVDRVLGLVPDDRLDDIVLIEPHDERTAAIPALMPGDDPQAQVALVDDLFHELFDIGSFVTGRWRRPGATALSIINAESSADATFVGLDAVMNEPEVRAGLLYAMDEGPLKRRIARWGRLDWDRATTNGSGISNSAGRYALDHAPRWSVDEAVNQGAIVLARLDLGALGTVDTGRFGRMLLRLVFRALTAGGSTAGEAPTRPDLSIIVDESHLFSKGPVLGALLAQARKFGASLTLCTQAPTRLEGGLLTDVLTNCGTSVAMQLPEREARPFAEREAGAPQAILSLPRFHGVAMLDDDMPSGLASEEPLVLHPLAPIDARPERAQVVAEQARRAFGRTPNLAARGSLTRFGVLCDELVEFGYVAAPNDLFGRHSPIEGKRAAEVERLIAEARAPGRAMSALHQAALAPGCRRSGGATRFCA